MTSWDQFTNSGAVAFLAIVGIVSVVLFPPLLIVFAIVAILAIIARVDSTRTAKRIIRERNEGVS